MKDKNISLNIKKWVKIYQIIFAIVLCMLLSLFIPPTSAHAAVQTLRVSPVIIDVTLSPGKTYNDEVTIENLTNTPLPLKANLNDFVTGGEDGGYVFENTRTNPLLSWIKLSDTEFILNPKEKKKIKMTIKTPTKIPVGGYYGVLFFEPVVQTSVANATQVSTKIGVLLLANLGVPDDEGQNANILTFTPPQLSQDGTMPFLLRVQNTSLNFFTAKPILTLTPLIGSNQSQKQIYLEEKLIFPDKVRRWTEDQTIRDLSPNIYKVHLVVATGNGKDITTDNYMLVFPLTKVVGILLVLIILILLIVKRKRFAKPAAALFSS